MAARPLVVKVEMTGVEPFAALVAAACNLVNALAPDEATLRSLPAAAHKPLAATQAALRSLGSHEAARRVTQGGDPLPPHAT